MEAQKIKKQWVEELARAWTIHVCQKCKPKQTIQTIQLFKKDSCQLLAKVCARSTG